MDSSPSTAKSASRISAVTLAIYLTASVTALPAAAVILPLLVSGLVLAWSGEAGGFIRAKRESFAAIVLFFISYMISTVLSYNVRDSLDACLVLFPGLLIAYIFGHLAFQHHRIVCWGIAGMVLSASLTTLWMFLESPSSDPGKVFMAGKTPSLVVANDMVLGVIFSPVIIYLLMTEKRPLLKLFLAFVLLTLVISLYFVKSRICFLTAAFIFTLYLYHYFRRNFLGWLAASAGIIFLVDHLLGLNILIEFMLISQQNARLSIWYAGLTSAFDHPIFGFGPAMFYMAYEQTMSTASFPEWMMVDQRTVPWAHNLYLDALVERGLVGFLALLYVVIKVYTPLVRYARDASGRVKQLEFAVYASFIGFLFAGFFELSMQRIWVANAFFMFVGFALFKANSIIGRPHKDTPRRQ
ncbi:O-antigen ligase family protein [Pseudomonadota bacterium]